MNDREKLIKLIMSSGQVSGFAGSLATYLIANDVVIQKQGEWCHFHTSIGTAICSNCHRLDHIDPLASYCRYCGTNMKEVK